MSDRLYLAARVVCVAIALALLPLTVVISIMLLRGPGPSPRQGLLLLVFGGIGLGVVLLAALAPQRMAAALLPWVVRRDSVVRTAVILLAAAGICVPVLSLLQRAL